MIPHHFYNFSNLNAFNMGNPYYNPFMPQPFLHSTYPYAMPPVYQSLAQNSVEIQESAAVVPEQNPRREKPASKMIRKSEKKSGDVDEYKTKQQNSQRNIMSNIAHHLMSYLRKSSKIRPILEKVILIHGLKITCEEFFSFISKIELKNYIRIKVLKQEWSSGKNDQNLAKAFRIMVNYFLNHKYFLWIQCSKKIKSAIKTLHMNKRRDFIRILKSGQ